MAHPSGSNSALLPERESTIQEELTIANSQNRAPLIPGSENPLILELLADITADTFFEDTDTLAQLGQHPSPIVASNIKKRLDPAKGDFLIYMRGRASLMDFYRANHHHSNLTKLRDAGRIPKSLQVPKRVNIFKPLQDTHLKIRSLQSQYESLLLSTIINHHSKTAETAKKDFKSTWEKAKQAHNYNIIALKWSTLHKTTMSDLETNRLRHQPQKRPNPATNPNTSPHRPNEDPLEGPSGRNQGSTRPTARSNTPPH